MMKKISILFVFSIFFLFGCSKANQIVPVVPAGTNADKIVLFYSLSCTHCQALEKYMADNEVEKKITLERKEISGSKDNLNEMMSMGVECGIASNQLGVPFLWNNGECLVGDGEIEKFFAGEINK
jgi:glutaredoxin-related protein